MPKTPSHNSRGRGVAPVRPAPGRHVRGRRTASDQDCRDLLLDAAQEIFFRKSILGGTVKEIALQAGLSYTMIYYYFDSKEGLACALADRSHRLFLEDLKSLDGSRGDGHPYLRVRSVLAVIQRHLGDKAILGCLFRDPAVPRFEALARNITRMQEEIHTWFRSFLAEGQRSGFIRADLDLEAVSRWLLPSISSDMEASPAPARFAPVSLTEILSLAEESWYETIWWSLCNHPDIPMPAFKREFDDPES